MSEKGKEAGIAVTAEELARINRFAKKELRAEEVYTFAVKLCDNEVDRDFERFDRAALEKLSELFVGRTGIFDHSWSAGGQTARIYRAEVIEEETRTTAGDKYCWCKGWAYMLRTEKNAELIAEIEGGIKKEVSVGCSAAKRSCSICGKDAGLCEHERGKYYGGKLCYAVLSDITDAYEWSFVAVPAQRAAGVVKRFGQGEGSLKAMVRACGSRAQVRELEELEKLSKEELIIELVKARRDMRNIRSVLGELSETGASSFMYDEGSKPSKDWLDRIVEYVDSRLNSDETLCAADLEMYGIDEETADRYVDALCSKEGL